MERGKEKLSIFTCHSLYFCVFVCKTDGSMTVASKGQGKEGGATGEW